MGKVRGRRAIKEKEKQEKRENESILGGDEVKIYNNDEDYNDNAEQSINEPNTFFGLVDNTELDYFKQAEATLNANVFENDEDRFNFVTSVLEESKGKELKLATNQICSKLFERLILSCNDAQLKQIFKDFNGHFKSLIHHKYSSHCVETLLVRVASLIEREILDPDISLNEEQYVSAENLFIMFLNEIEPFVNEMIKHQYASHTLRLVILILSGNELPSTTKRNSTLRSKKSKIARKMIDIKDNEDFNKSFQTPASFKVELGKIINKIKVNLDLKKAREYSIDKIASPVLQLLLQVEGLVDRDRPIWHLVFLPENHEKDQKEESYMEYLLSDPIGSHFLQHAVEFAKVKYSERLFNYYMKERVLKLIKRSKTGDFIILTLLRKLKQNEVRYILDQLIPELDSLFDLNIEIGITVIEASEKHGSYKKEAIISKIVEKIDESKDLLEYFLKLSTSTLGNSEHDDWPTMEERKRTEFLNKLISYDDEFLHKIIINLLDQLELGKFILMGKHSIFSRLIENILLNHEKLSIIERRRLLNLFIGKIPELSCNVYGSHIVDKLWVFSFKLNNYKERFAKELFDNKDIIKESAYGRLVWKNWAMEKYVRKRHDWNYLVKQEEFEIKKVEESQNPDLGNKKRKIEDGDGDRKQKIRGRNRK
ncbi:hypothetical protein WICMUC_000674 [Wickerhamomyces mucosus]|uniref:Nucleolar protein 9 n=1 Tax=Wickerhamomyces mucosus TaxID=1378264 RepID=A0A9P8PX18_9ASCO|nr:hypothetical protein WICMUC_000674 [Wickerhamomyces mucosus]